MAWKIQHTCTKRSWIISTRTFNDWESTNEKICWDSAYTLSEWWSYKWSAWNTQAKFQLHYNPDTHYILLYTQFQNQNHQLHQTCWYDLIKTDEGEWMLWMMGKWTLWCSGDEKQFHWKSNCTLSFMETKTRKSSKIISRKFNFITLIYFLNKHRQTTRQWISPSCPIPVETVFYRVFPKICQTDIRRSCCR